MAHMCDLEQPQQPARRDQYYRVLTEGRIEKRIARGAVAARITRSWHLRRFNICTMNVLRVSVSPLPTGDVVFGFWRNGDR